MTTPLLVGLPEYVEPPIRRFEVGAAFWGGLPDVAEPELPEPELLLAAAAVVLAAAPVLAAELVVFGEEELLPQPAMSAPVTPAISPNLHSLPSARFPRRSPSPDAITTPLLSSVPASHVSATQIGDTDTGGTVTSSLSRSKLTSRFSAAQWLEPNNIVSRGLCTIHKVLRTGIAVAFVS